MAMIAKFNKTTEKIWNYLIERLKNPSGVAALMGAVYASSTFKPNLVNTYGKEEFKRMDVYTSMVNNGNRPMNIFVHDGYSYGICQWNRWASKQGLFNMARKQKRSIGSLDLQLDFLWDELHTSENHQYLNQLMSSKRMDVCEAAAYGYMKSQDKKLQMGAVSTFAHQFYDFHYMHMTKNDIETKYTMSRREREEFMNEMEKKDKRVVAWANNVIVRIADNCKAKEVGSLRTDITYEYVMSNEKKTWHCIVFDGKLRWVSNKHTQVIGV